MGFKNLFKSIFKDKQDSGSGSGGLAHTQQSSQSRISSNRQQSMASSFGTIEYGLITDEAFQAIGDRYTTVEEVGRDMELSGVGKVELIIGVDFSKSNKWAGRKSFGGKCLHQVDGNGGSNPYEEVIAIIARTLGHMDPDNLIDCYGFADVSTMDSAVFSFNPGDMACQGVEGALSRYRELAQTVELSGPTSFGPIIRQALRVVQENDYRYHLLVIISDGGITRNVDPVPEGLSPWEQDSKDALVEASYYPLSVITVGVGDGPWDVMRYFDDNLKRQFDNFQFVDFMKIKKKVQRGGQQMEAVFAVQALMEVPDQYKHIMQNGYIGNVVETTTLDLSQEPLDPPDRA
eukprot:TRINITY_DN14368_c0_g1_i6.p2 TRINITY_DN14368_c0_g1~~TRINITY_DN14368_c0_g1_i6.p2  ORF type:complete len:347 (+),score=52.39 TRINITY_DN14368_c0_g1_i6:46-1086(+)